MTLDRAELAGTGAAVLFHVALIGALSIGLARVASPPEPPAMEVDLVEEVGLQAAAPTPSPPASQAPEMGEEPAVDPTPAVAAPALPRAPRIVPTPNVDAAERLKRDIDRTKREDQEPAKAQPAKPAPRVSRLGDDFLKGIEAPSAPAKPAAATFSGAAVASIAQAIRRQVQPCANRQVNPGPGSNRIKVTLHLRLSRGGRLIAPPEVVRIAGVDDENERYVDRVKDLAVNTFVGCSPLSGLPPELYKTANGQGWGDFRMTYNLP